MYLCPSVEIKITERWLKEAKCHNAAVHTVLRPINIPLTEWVHSVLDELKKMKMSPSFF